MVEKLFLETFLKNQNWAYLRINSVRFYTVYFYCMPSLGLSKYSETKLHTTCFYLILSFCKKQNKCLELVPLPHFLHDFLRKIFILLYSINWPNFIAWLSLLREILGYMFIIIVCYPGCDVTNFKINLMFLIKTVFIYDQKVKIKI